jgi:hypothetical protein
VARFNAKDRAKEGVVNVIDTQEVEKAERKG